MRFCISKLVGEELVIWRVESCKRVFRARARRESVFLLLAGSFHNEESRRNLLLRGV